MEGLTKILIKILVLVCLLGIIYLFNISYINSGTYTIIEDILIFSLLASTLTARTKPSHYFALALVLLVFSALLEIVGLVKLSESASVIAYICLVDIVIKKITRNRV